jgi:nickel/cobalt transporter (NicO) family protein
MLQTGAASSWLFVPSAMLLGALHGLEPGHSKTMMAAFIIAIRGSVAQAIMLGLAATVSHTAVVWAVALVGMHFGSQWSGEAIEPYFQVAAAIMIVGVAVWMVWRTSSHLRAASHDHDHGAEARRIDTGHGILRLEIVENGLPPRLRVTADDAQCSAWLSTATVSADTERADGSVQRFSFVGRANYLESAEEVPEPHEFIVRLRLGHDDHSHDYDLEYTEHGHAHAVSDYAGMDVTAPGYQDPHELAHANDIRHRFANREVTNGQILMFGLTGGLVPCPASITVLLICLQLKKVTLGAVLVLCFSIGLATTLVLSGVVAAVSVRHASKRWSGFGELARKAPYFSGAVILLVGLYVGYQGLNVILR